MTKKGAVIIEGHVQGLSNTRSLGEAGIPVIVANFFIVRILLLINLQISF